MNPKRAPEVGKTIIGAILTLILIGLSSSVFGQEPTTLTRIRIGMPNRGVPNLGLIAAERYGFFRTQGLEAELIVMRPSLSLQTLMAGDLDFSTVLASAARASVSGLPFRIIMALTVGQDFHWSCDRIFAGWKILKARLWQFPGLANLQTSALDCC